MGRGCIIVGMGISRRRFVEGAAAVGVVAAVGEGRGLGQAAASEGSGMSLRDAGAGRGLLVGCAVAVWALNRDAAYKDLVKGQAGIVVGENEFKFASLRPSATEFNFKAADELAEFAAANGMKLRGHNFVWHRQIPGWFEGYVTPANAEEVLVKHIETVGGRYAGKIHSWDVVNEAVLVEDGLPGGMRKDSAWQKVLPGEEFGVGGNTVPKYVEVAFRTARRVDPKALLCYNDYGIEGEDAGSEKKRKAVLGLLRGMQAKGIPVDGLGVQSHISAGGKAVYGAGLMKMIAEARTMGLKVLVTEMDVNDRALGPEIPLRDKAVAEVYGSYLKMVLGDPAVIAVLTWGITDKYTWLNGEDARADKVKERPLPFDAEMKAKLAVGAMKQGIEGRG
jgi:endo-1,4-beta-xylanase